MDPNKNRTQMVYDELGQNGPLSRFGKDDEKQGGSTQDVTAVLPSERLVSLIQDPHHHSVTVFLEKQAFDSYPTGGE
ncbi:uncharacterized protein FSUBG_343 [Fusarium subglutinans]|uniref:Uncharacterized protein n=1 Tax=Gibberella subglutinans TaxID=42677 RepID=A0A8H5QH71_GIBSU|nr:uncharacterized protein FSUBG_343 [Fusarium subglutinans]KAF5613731.1 hypothetical protein FSUBG_343 [Fusarium subglutinans]